MSVVATTMAEIDTLTDHLKAKIEPKAWDDKLQQLKLDLEAFEKKMKDVKLHKF